MKINQLIEDFATYLYLPRIVHEKIIHTCLKNGLHTLVINPDTFVYAASWDEQIQEYRGLTPSSSAIVFDSMCLLVKPEIAQEQIDRKERERVTICDTGD